MSQSARKQDVVAPGVSTDPINRRILVVEDEHEIAQAYSQILNPSNVVPLRRSSRQTAPTSNHVSDQLPPYEIVTVHDGETALQEVEKALAAGQPFALGFIDVLLGTGMDGLELVKRIQSLDPEMHFVFVTAYQDRSVDAIHQLLGSQNADRWDYLNKPFSEGEILQKARSKVAHWNIRREKKLREKQISELQRKIQESERWVSVAAVSRSMGHELGNLLVQIIGRADLGKKKNETEMKQSFEQIIKAGEAAAAVIDRFKNIAKPSSQLSRKVPLRLASVVQDVVLLMEFDLRRSNTKVDLDRLDEGQILGNASSLTQVLVNLVLNSLHAQGANKKLKFEITKTDEFVELTLKDEGPGVPEENLVRLCEPFFTTKGENGTGLGLAISREIVEIEHAGELIFDNHPEGGLVARLQFPRLKAKGGA